MGDRLMSGLPELQLCKRAGLLDFPPELSKAVGAAARLSTRRQELFQSVDWQAAFRATVEQTERAALKGATWPTVEVIIEAEETERRRKLSAQVVEAARSRVSGTIDGILDAHAVELIHQLDAALQKLVHDRATLDDADGVPVGEDASQLIQRGGEMSDRYNRLVAEVSRILLVSAAWSKLLHSRCPPEETPPRYVDVINLSGGMIENVWRKPLMVDAPAPWGRSSDQIAQWHYFLAKRTPVKFRTGPEIDADYRAWTVAGKAAKVAASA
jgi:hypothetical protein